MPSHAVPSKPAACLLCISPSSPTPSLLPSLLILTLLCSPSRCFPVPWPHPSDLGVDWLDVRAAHTGKCSSELHFHLWSAPLAEETHPLMARSGHKSHCSLQCFTPLGWEMGLEERDRDWTRPRRSSPSPGGFSLSFHCPPAWHRAYRKLAASSLNAFESHIAWKGHEKGFLTS